jgi:ABC-type proline/glycine betaine transport system permease subunit
MDEHILLDLIAQAEIILKGIHYGVLVQDIDTVRKAVIDLKDCVETMDSIVEYDFGE